MSRSSLILALPLLLLAGCDRAAEAPAQPVAQGEAAKTPTGLMTRQFAGTPIPAIAAALFARFDSQGHADPANRLLGQAQAEVAHFMYDRLVGYLRDQGASALEVDAVVALRPAGWAELPKRLAAVRAFAALPEAPALAAANKRVGNILKKADAAVEAKVDAALLKEAAEQALYAALQTVAPAAQTAFEQGDYTASLQALAALRTPVDAFFDSVMVNADDAALKANRLGLLASLHQAMNQVADLSRLAV